MEYPTSPFVGARQSIFCGRSKSLRSSDKSLLNGLRLPPYTPVLDLEPRLRCRECDARGKSVVSIRWAAS